MNDKRNIYDKKDSLEIGEKAQNIFKHIARERGWEVTKASKDEDINEHWDWSIEKGAEKYKIDVKAMKRLSRSDPNVQDKWMWIELHGVRPYDRGWLYDGKADLIAFEKKESFLIVRRSDLIKLVERLVDMNKTVASAREAKYKVYSRPGRPDKITMIEMDKLNSVIWDEWPKFRY